MNTFHYSHISISCSKKDKETRLEMVIIHSNLSFQKESERFMCAIRGSKYTLDPWCLLRSLTLPDSQQLGTLTLLFFIGQKMFSLWKAKVEAQTSVPKPNPLCIKISKMIHSVNPTSTHQQENKLRRHYIFL